MVRPCSCRLAGSRAGKRLEGSGTAVRAIVGCRPRTPRGPSLGAEDTLQDEVWDECGPDWASRWALSREPTCRSYDTLDEGQCQFPCSDGDASCPAGMTSASHASDVLASLRMAVTLLWTRERPTSVSGRPVVKRERRELMLWRTPVISACNQDLVGRRPMSTT